MSAAVIARLAARWGCSVQQVRERITARLVTAGLVSADESRISEYRGEPFARKLVLGVTDEDRVAVLDAQDRVILWLDDDAPVRH